MSTSNSNIKWPHVPGDKRPFFGPNLALQPPTPWRGPWEQTDTKSRKRRRDEDEQAANAPQIEPERVFDYSRTTHAFYLAEQAHLARKVRVTPALIVNQNSQRFRIADIGDHFTSWLSDNLHWLWEEYVVREVHWRRAKATIDTKEGTRHCKHIDAAQRVKLIWLKQDAKKRDLLEKNNDKDDDDHDSSDSSDNGHDGSLHPLDDSSNDSASNSYSYNYHLPRAQMPVPQVLPPHLIPRPIPRPVRPTIPSTGPPRSTVKPTRTSSAFEAALKTARFPKFPIQSNTSTLTGIVGQVPGSVPEEILVQGVPVGQSASSAPSSQPVDGYSASSSQPATRPKTSETPATETARPENGIESSSESVSEADSESSKNVPDFGPSSWRNVFGNPGLWVGPGPTQNTGLGNSMMAKTKPTTRAAQYNPVDTLTAGLEEDGSNRTGDVLPIGTEKTQAAQTRVRTASTTQLSQTQLRRSARLEQLQNARTEASQPAAQTDPSTLAYQTTPSQPATQTEATRPTESQQSSHTQSQPPSNQQNAIVPQPLPGFFPCPRCTYHNAVTDTWCTSCGALFSNFTSLPGPAQRYVGLHQIDNNDDELAKRNNAQVDHREEDYEMTGGAGPSGTVDESGNRPLATEQEKRDAERRRENLRQEQIRAERIPNRDIRPYYPPNHEYEGLTDDETRRRAEVAAYMANEQKVKYRLKRIRFVRDRAVTAGELFSPTMLSSFTGTPEERAQIAQDLATIEREDAESDRRQRQYGDFHDQIRSAVRQSQNSIYPFTHFMPSWTSLSTHEQQYARSTVCAINEEAIAPTRLERRKKDKQRHAAERAALEALSPSSSSDTDTDETIMRDFKNDLIHKRFENGEQQFREWWNTSHMTGDERELYKRAIREINADAQGWRCRGSKARPMSTRVDPLGEATGADRLARFAGTIERLRGEGLGVPENIKGWYEAAPERRHRVWWELERLDAGDGSEEEPLTEELRLMMLAVDREALVAAGLDAPENLPSWGGMTEDERDQVRRDWESLEEQGRMMHGGE